MKTKEAQEYLKQPQRLETIIRNKMIERQQMMDIALSVTSGGESVLVEYNGKKELQNMEKVQASGSQSKLADAVSRCVDIDAEINSFIDNLVDTKRDVVSTIEQFNTTEYDVLHKLYIQGMTFDEVAVEKNRSKSWVTTIHGRALANVQSILNERKSK